MIKTVPTLGRIAVMALFALSSFSACLYLWMAFGGSSPMRPKSYELHIAFPEATQLADQSDVRISGVSVGKVVKLEPHDNRTLTTLRLNDQFAPIPENTKAILRVKSLLGETYVELTPGNRKGPQVPDGGTLIRRPAWRRPSSSTRSWRPSTRRRARRSRPGCRPRRPPSRAGGPTSTRSSASCPS